MTFGTWSSKLGTVRRNATRYWPLWASALGLLLLVAWEFYRYSYNNLLVSSRPILIASSLYAMAAAILVYQELFQSRYANALHSLPVTRIDIFIANTLSGLAFLLIPLVPMFPICCSLLGVAEAFFWCLAVSVYYLYGFTVGTLASVLSGTRLGALVNAMLLAFGIPMLEYALYGVSTYLLIGLEASEPLTIILSPMLQLADLYIPDPSTWNYFAVVSVVCVVVLVLTMLLYRRRKVESAGDFIAFAPMNIVVKALLTIMGGIYGGQILASILDLDGTPSTVSQVLVWLVSGVLIARMAAEILVERTVWIFKGRQLLHYGLAAIVAVVCVLILDADPLKAETRVPEAGDVSYVSVSNYSFYFYDNNVQMEDPEDIEKATELHRLITENLETNTSYDHARSYGEPVYFRYKLKNGQTLTRKYWLYFSADEMATPSNLYHSLYRYFNDPERLFDEMIVGDYDLEGAKAAVISADITYNYEQAGITVSKPGAQALLDALWMDTAAGNMDCYFVGGVEYSGATIIFNFMMRSDDPDLEAYENVWLELPATAEHTLAYLESLT